jgi:NADPH:quinone reductase-like Zn-dependent oxidoreductase
MKALRIHETGGPDILTIETLPDPKPSRGEALVRMEFCAVNHLDIWARMGNVPVFLPRVLGSEGVGVVEALGPETSWDGGNAVVVTPWVYPDDNRHQPLNAYAGVLGVARDGCYAQKTIVPVSCLRPLPPGLAKEQAAGLTLTAATAYHMAVTLAGVKPGERVFIAGATGGVGLAAIQICRAAGAMVYAASRNPEKRRRLKDWGAHETFDTSGAYDKDVRDATAGLGVDVVLETVGKSTWEKSISILKPGGRLAFCGSTSGPEVTVNLQRIYRNELSLLGSYGATPAETDAVLRLAEEGILKGAVDRILPLEEAADAHRLMEEARHFGKILLSVPE